MDLSEKKELRVHIRWMIRRDMPEIIEVENRSFEFPWSEEDFVRCLRQRNCIGMVAEYGDQVVGFMIYELHKNRLHILNFAVHPEYRKSTGSGCRWSTSWWAKLSHQRRSRILLEVRERNLVAQVFFRARSASVRFLCCGIFTKIPIEDAYLMEYRYQPTLEEALHADESNYQNGRLVRRAVGCSTKKQEKRPTRQDSTSGVFVLTSLPISFPNSLLILIPKLPSNSRSQTPFGNRTSSKLCFASASSESKPPQSLEEMHWKAGAKQQAETLKASKQITSIAT